MASCAGPVFRGKVHQRSLLPDHGTGTGSANPLTHLSLRASRQKVPILARRMRSGQREVVSRLSQLNGRNRAMEVFLRSEDAGRPRTDRGERCRLPVALPTVGGACFVRWAAMPPTADGRLFARVGGGTAEHDVGIVERALQGPADVAG